MNKGLIVTTIVALLAATAFISSQVADSSAFDEWKAQYGANWGKAEEFYRRAIFEKNLMLVEKHNADATQTYKLAINQFSAMTNEEFAATYLSGLVVPEGVTPMVGHESEPVSNDIDWTTKGGVSRVKNQGSCGSCWAFSATGVIEAFYKVKGQTVDLSEQQLVDCSKPQGNHGCNGGWPSSALNYVKAYGITSESAYPYTARDGACSTQGGATKISGQSSFSGCNGLQNGINGKPVSVTVDATNWSHYSSGVFNNCGASINHAVLLVGVVGGNWKIKNSWGTGWGEAGFIRLASGNTCGVCAYAGVVPN